MPNEQRKEEDNNTLTLRKPAEVVKSLGDQYALYERCGRELRDRVRRELLTIRADHERRWANVKQEFDRKISEAIARLEVERADAEHQLIDAFNLRKSEAEALLARIEE